MTAPTDLLLTCSCSTLSHLARFSVDGDNDPRAYIQIVLDRDESIWRRLRNAWRHILKRDCGYVTCAEVVLSPADVLALAQWSRDAATVLWGKP